MAGSSLNHAQKKQEQNTHILVEKVNLISP